MYTFAVLCFTITNLEIMLEYKHIVTGESGLRPGMKITINVLMKTRVRKNADI